MSERHCGHNSGRAYVREEKDSPREVMSRPRRDERNCSGRARLSQPHAASVTRSRQRRVHRPGATTECTSGTCRDESEGEAVGRSSTPRHDQTGLVGRTDYEEQLWAPPKEQLDDQQSESRIASSVSGQARNTGGTGRRSQRASSGLASLIRRSSPVQQGGKAHGHCSEM